MGLVSFDTDPVRAGGFSAGDCTRLLAALAFEMIRTGNYHGVDEGEFVGAFREEVWRRHFQGTRDSDKQQNREKIAVSMSHPTSRPSRRPMLLSPLWLQAIVLTFVVGFAILGYLAIRVYQDHAPIPARIASESGQTFLTEDDILGGQEHFLTYGLMEFGTIYGHGAYLGPDFTADYLHREALHM